MADIGTRQRLGRGYVGLVRRQRSVINLQKLRGIIAYRDLGYSIRFRLNGFNDALMAFPLAITELIQIPFCGNILTHCGSKTDFTSLCCRIHTSDVKTDGCATGMSPADTDPILRIRV